MCRSDWWMYNFGGKCEEGRSVSLGLLSTGVLFDMRYDNIFCC